MKFLVVIICSILFFSCQHKKLDSLESLKIDEIDSIPFLMTQIQIDSVIETVTYGKIGNSKMGQTYNRYVFEKHNTIRQNRNSILCCSYIYEYDSIGILSKKSKFTDYRTNYNYKYSRSGNSIIKIEESNFEDSKRHFYYLNNGKIVLKTVSSNSDSELLKTVAYQYNNDHQIIKKVIDIKNQFEGTDNNRKVTKTYSWMKSILRETITKQYVENGIDYFETITTFDSIGFPASTVIKENKDTICMTLIKKY